MYDETMGLADRIKREPSPANLAVGRVVYGNGSIESKQDELVRMRSETQDPDALAQIDGYLEMLARQASTRRD